MIRALIFDFDGLILDTELADFRSWQDTYRAYGCELSFSAWAVCIGTAMEVADPYGHLEAQLGHPVDREAVRATRRERYVELVEALPVLPGVEAYITEAKRLGLRLGLASCSRCDWIVYHLSRLGLLPHFDCLRCADDVAQIKPDPELYCAVLEGLGLRAEEAIALEDSPNGVLSAKRAGLFCVAVPNVLTRQLSLEQADLIADSLADMPLQELLLWAEQGGRQT